MRLGANCYIVMPIYHTAQESTSYPALVLYSVPGGHVTLTTYPNRSLAAASGSHEHCIEWGAFTLPHRIQIQGPGRVAGGPASVLNGSVS